MPNPIASFDKKTVKSEPSEPRELVGKPPRRHHRNVPAEVSARRIVRFYRNVLAKIPKSKRPRVAAMLKAIHAMKSREASASALTFGSSRCTTLSPNASAAQDLPHHLVLRISTAPKAGSNLCRHSSTRRGRYI